MTRTVCIIDDDEAIRESLRLLLFAAGFQTRTFASADHYLAEGTGETFDCMLLDIRMPGTDGLDLFRQLMRERVGYPIIFITGHGDIPLAVAAIQQGAFDFLTKPFEEGQLLERIGHAIERYEADRDRRRTLQEIKRRLATCTPRERDVLDLMVQGLPNKGIADHLAISPRTVEIHRAHVMEKMEADSLATLVRMITVVEPDLNGDADAPGSPG
ncbi:response regulator transcription factor [Elongatibacter sediminis]|uniref:Response regulator n=1 Tax=Elongatibacter sediminis TaxID=3119006 RepID=A0AAW9R9C3_9GAMM